ncbi:MAG: hypothetical protein EAS51_13180 [Microbacteriaceae bacterium]|nr:MAG: hypothetical protein EAS51_13180 [Microbacteriaceae bacterium]
MPDFRSPATTIPIDDQTRRRQVVCEIDSNLPWPQNCSDELTALLLVNRIRMRQVQRVTEEFEDGRLP